MARPLPGGIREDCSETGLSERRDRLVVWRAVLPAAGEQREISVRSGGNQWPAAAGCGCSAGDGPKQCLKSASAEITPVLADALVLRQVCQPPNDE